jgi:hypothetical protein
LIRSAEQQVSDETIEELQVPTKINPNIDELPKLSATYVRTRWPYLKRKVRQAGCVSITRYGKVQVVMVSAALYREMVALAEEVHKHRR